MSGRPAGSRRRSRPRARRTTTARRGGTRPRSWSQRQPRAGSRTCGAPPRAPRATPASGGLRGAQEPRDLDQRAHPLAAQRRVTERPLGARYEIVDLFAGVARGVAVGHVVPELERLPHQPPEHPQGTLGLRSGPRERGADHHRTLGGVRPGLQRTDPGPIAHARHIQELTGGHLDAHAIEAGHRGFEPAGPEPARSDHPLRQHQREIADQDRGRGPEPLGVHTGRRLVGEPDVGRCHAAALDVPVHQVVVHERGGVQELECPADPNDRIVLTATRRSERPEAQRGPDPLPAGAQQAKELVDQRNRGRIHPRKLRAAVAEEPDELPVHRPANGVDRRRRRGRRDTVLRRHAGSMPTHGVVTPPAARRDAIVRTSRARTMTRFQKLTIATTASTVLLITAGGLVRATGSGLGCPGWPTCFGRWIPPLETHPIIEYSHRLLATIAVILICLQAVVAWRQYRRVRQILLPSLAAVGLVFVQAALGGVVVKGELESTLVTLHFATAMTLLAVLVNVTANSFCYVRLPLEGPPIAGSDPRFVRLTLWTAAAAFALLIVGASVRAEAAGLAFRDWPLMDGRLVPTLGGVATLMFVHRLLAALVLLLVIWVAIRARTMTRRSKDLVVLSSVTLLLYVAQIFVGAANVWSSLSAASVTAHVVLSALIWGVL